MKVRLLPYILIIIVTILQGCVIKTVNVYESEDVEIRMTGSEFDVLEGARASLK